MTNAQKLSAIFGSPKLWIEHFLKITNKSGKMVAFKLNPEQMELLKNSDKYNIVLKSRQLGITSVSCGLSLYYACTCQNSTCLLVSYSIDSATGIFEKLKQLYYSLPESVKPKLLANNKKELKFSNGSRIIVATCGTKDIGRGLTIKFCHFSEVAFMKEDVIGKQILAVEQALMPDGAIILESTANGLNKFSEHWNRAVNNENMYKPFFFSWIDDKIMFAEEYKQFANRYLALNQKMLEYEDLDEVEREYLNLGASLEQLVWRRIKIKNSSAESFQQEFPSNPLEAFVTTGSNLFDANKLHERFNVAKDFPSLNVMDSLPVSLRPYMKRTLKLWGEPKAFEKYYIGVDASEGIGQDFSVAEVFDAEMRQVAEFRSNYIKPYEFAQVVNDLGKFYHNALLVVEKASAGHVVLDRLKNILQYRNMYKHKEYDQRGNVIKKVGFLTTSKSKPLMLNDFIELWDTNQIQIYSKELLQEMKLFQYIDGKMQGSSGTHDDTVLATALSIVGLKSGLWYI